MFTNIFGQTKKIEVLFNVKSNIKYFNKEEIIYTLRADVILENTKFSLHLIDYNHNGEFSDFRTFGSKTGSDGIFITQYKEIISYIDKNSRRYLTKDYPFFIKNTFYRLKSLKKNGVNEYKALLVNDNVNPSEIVKNRNGVFIDSLPKIKLTAYNKSKSIELKQILKNNNFLFLNFYNDDDNNFINFYTKSTKLKKLKKSFPSLKIINVGIVNNSKKFEYYAKSNKINLNDFFIIGIKEHNKIFKMGYNFNPINGYLFNDKGKIVLSNVSVNDLSKYLYKQRRTTLLK